MLSAGLINIIRELLSRTETHLRSDLVDLVYILVQDRGIIQVTHSAVDSDTET